MAEGIGMPSSSGGLVRYYDEYKSKLQIKPIYIAILVALVAIVEIALTKLSAA
jgi:preprotein translocase subunit Sec61beta